MAEVRQPSMIGALVKPELDADGRLADDVHCRRCGYSLRGLLPGGVCPECSTPVGRSIHGDLLKFSDPNWVMHIARGGSVLAASIILMIVMPLAIAPFYRILGMGVLGVALSVPKVVQIIGVWLATTPDPALHHREAPFAARTLARYGSIIAAGVTIAAYLAGGRASSAMVVLLPPSAGSSRVFQAAAQLLIAALTITSMIALLRYARTLARRLPDAQILRQCAGVEIALAIILGGKVVFDVALTISGAGPVGRSFNSTLSALNSALHLATVVCMWWCMVLIFKFRIRLKHVARLARETWARPVR